MGITSVNKCLITGVEVTDNPSELDAIEYSILYHGHSFSFIFQSNVEWAKVISGKIQTTLMAMLYNNEWPIDKETFITEKLIANIIRLAKYPKTFQEKLDYFLIQSFNTGGAEYRSVKYNLANFQAAYADDPDVFISILDGLEERGFIKFSKARTNINRLDDFFKLTEAGRKEAEQLIKASPTIEKLKIPFDLRPGICICYVKGDEAIGKNVSDFFSTKDFTILNPGNSISGQNDDGYLRSIRDTIYNTKLNYIVFIKSFKSDINTTFASALTIAVEEHSNKRKDSKFIYIGFADDSDYDARSRIIDYHTQMYDLRLNAQRDRILVDMLSDFTSKLRLKPGFKSEKVKYRFLNWLLTQSTITGANPITIQYSHVQKYFTADEELVDYLEDLKNEEYINYTVRDHGPTTYSEYYVTLLQKATDWVNGKNNEEIPEEGTEFKLNLKRLTITEWDEKWLRIVYEKFLKGEHVQLPPLFAQYWEEFPEDFQPENIDHRLLKGGNDITVFGIWHIDPTATIFKKLDETVRIIRTIIAEGKEIRRIDSSTIISKSNNLRDLDVRLSMDLLWHLSGFMSTVKREPDPKNGCTIELNDDRIFERYRKYKGLNKLLHDWLEEDKPKELRQASENETDEYATYTQQKAYYKFPINIKDSKVDPVLGVKELAKDLAEIILDIPNEQGKMIGVFGRWGRGKSFFINELWLALDALSKLEKHEYIKVDYHAWKYQDTPASWAYLYETLAAKYNPEPKNGWKFWTYICYYIKTLNLNVYRHGVWQLIKIIFAIGFAFFTAFGFVRWGKELTLSFIPYIGIPVVASAVVAFLNKVKKEHSITAKELIKKYTSKTSFKESLGLQAEIQKELVSLLKVWISEKNISNKKIVLFVEDIDRCTEDKIIQNIDALRIIMEDPDIATRLIIIAAIDERVLKRAVKLKYKDLVKLDNNGEASADRLNELTTEYLDKLFISGIKLGGLSENERIEFFDVLTKSDRAEIPVQSPPKKEGKLPDTVFEDLEKEKIKKLIDKLAELDEEWDVALENGNIIFKDGEVSLENEYGEVKTLSEITKENFNKATGRKQKKTTLTKDEVDILRKHLLKWENTTPRKIRIFYYRYLLAKNLLISRYRKKQRENMWQSKELCDYFVGSLITYSENHDPEVLHTHKFRAISNAHDNSGISELRKYKIKNHDLAEMLSVLELVIAY